MLKRFANAVELKMIQMATSFKKSERGDTNFISILIILGVVILLAGIFIGFKDQIVGQVQQIINGFQINGGAGGQTPTP